MNLRTLGDMKKGNYTLNSEKGEDDKNKKTTSSYTGG
jgi:hypothetical protein